MALKKHSRLSSSFGDLDRALEAYEPSEQEQFRSLSFFALSKAFEVSLEYLWKYLRYEVEDKGLEAPSPKDAVRVSAEIGLSKNPELLIKAINVRNQSVHDYFSMNEEEFVAFVESYSQQVKTDLKLQDSLS